jgi:(p)ppGpp synthase/HD superfamily hydrolase
MTQIQKAIDFARIAHKGQTYADQEYFYHLQKTYEVAVKFELTEEIQIACYLHDVLEDTDASFDELWDEFGWFIAHLVYLVTDEEGSNRKERKLKTYAKTKKLHEAILLKLCDRIANVEACIEFDQDGLMKMYQKEQSLFESELNIWDLEKIKEMFTHLNNLLK